MHTFMLTLLKQLIKRRNLQIGGNTLAIPLVSYDSLSFLSMPLALQFQTKLKAWDSNFVEQIINKLLVFDLLMLLGEKMVPIVVHIRDRKVSTTKYRKTDRVTYRETSLINIYLTKKL